MNHLTKCILTAIALAASSGCWQEVRFDPSTEGPGQTPAVFVSSSESASEPSDFQDSDTETQLASDPPAGNTAAPAAQPDQPTAELPEPVWNEPTSEQQPMVSTKPAPPAKLDWLEDEPTATPPAVPRSAAWQLGSKWSLAIGIYGKGYGADRYGTVVDKAGQAADALNVSLPAIPTNSGSPLSTAIEFLRETEGPRLVESIGRSHSPQHEALCQLAIVSHALLLDYSAENASLSRTVIEIKELAQRAELPERLWQPVIDALQRRAEFQDVKQAVLKLHRETAQHLERVE